MTFFSLQFISSLTSDANFNDYYSGSLLFDIVELTLHFMDFRVIIVFFNFQSIQGMKVLNFIETFML